MTNTRRNGNKLVKELKLLSDKKLNFENRIAENEYIPVDLKINETDKIEASRAVMSFSET